MSEKIQIRRGTNAERTTVTLDQGEPAWTTDTKRLYIGDGATVGGCLVNVVTGSVLLNSANILTGTTSVLVTGNENRFVHTTGVELINGNKTFSGQVNFNYTDLPQIVCTTIGFNGDYYLDFSQGSAHGDAGSLSFNWITKVLSGNWQIATSSPPTGDYRSNGIKGQLALSGGFLYACTGNSLWGRTQLLTF